MQFLLLDGTDFYLTDLDLFFLIEEDPDPILIPNIVDDQSEDVHLSSYFRRYANDRDELNTIEDVVNFHEAAPVEETSDDEHFEDYIRRYSNDV